MRARTDKGLVLVQTSLRRAAALAQAWRRLVGAAYRPEKHYMRGPGPKWREKHAEVETRPPSDRVPGR